MKKWFAVVLGFQCLLGRSQAHKLEELQSIIDSAHVKGALLIYDENQNSLYCNDYLDCQIGYLPASTFKICNTMIGLETGAIKSKDSLFYWDGNKRMFSIWERDMNLREAFQSSCVPCFQEVARKIGPQEMKEWLLKLKYGNDIEINAENIDQFWLKGEFKISVEEQIVFLKSLLNKTLPISPETQNQMWEIMRVYGDSSLYAKTGWAQVDGKDQGWYVGIKKTVSNNYIFALHIEDLDSPNFMNARKSIALEGLKFIIQLEEQSE